MAKKQVEWADICATCQKNHIRNKGFKMNKHGDIIKEWPVECKGIQKKLFDGCRYNEETKEVEVGLYDLEAEIDSEILKELTPEAIVRAQYQNNIMLWAKDMLGWSCYNPNREWYQYYQKEFLMCTAQHKVGRFSRRLGKTEMIVVKSPHFCDTFNGSNPKAVIVVPFQNLASEIFNRLKGILDSDTSVFRGKISSRQKPFQEISWERGAPYNDTCYIRGFTTGASSSKGAVSLRGQKADILLLDEAAYLHPADYGAIIPLLEERKAMELWSFSTPSALENNFKKWCLTDPVFKDFHYPYDVLKAIYTEEEFEEKSALYKRTLGHIRYKLEFEAGFYEDDDKVFSEHWIKASGKQYSYYKNRYHVPDFDRKKFYMGVDWNSWKNGINIAILSYDTSNGMVETVHKALIAEETKHQMKYDKIQMEGIDRVLTLFKEFQCDGVAVDSGYGSLHGEVLMTKMEQLKCPEKLKIVDFYGTTETEHPDIPEQKVKQRNKPLLVSLLKDRLEGDRFRYSSLEEGILRDAEMNKTNFPYQANMYVIEKFDVKGMPIFKGPVDHYLDAVMLANFFIAHEEENFFEVGVKYSVYNKNKVEKAVKIDGLIKKFSHSRFNQAQENEDIEDIVFGRTMSKPEKDGTLRNSSFFGRSKSRRSTLKGRRSKNPFFD